MPAGATDKTKPWLTTPAPVVVLVEPQLGENIGAAARAMANFGLSRLRLVNPRQGRAKDRAPLMGARGGGGVRARAAGRRRGPLSSRQGLAREKTSRSCLGASAMGLRTTKWRWPMLL